jgi:hypothetical protein
MQSREMQLTFQNDVRASYSGLKSKPDMKAERSRQPDEFLRSTPVVLNFFVHVPPDIISLQLCGPEVLGV